jgi:hypothetical protein
MKQRLDRFSDNVNSYFWYVALAISIGLSIIVLMAFVEGILDFYIK